MAGEIQPISGQSSPEAKVGPGPLVAPLELGLSELSPSALQLEANRLLGEAAKLTEERIRLADELNNLNARLEEYGKPPSPPALDKPPGSELKSPLSPPATPPPPPEGSSGPNSRSPAPLPGSTENKSGDPDSHKGAGLTEPPAVPSSGKPRGGNGIVTNFLRRVRGNTENRSAKPNSKAETNNATDSPPNNNGPDSPPSNSQVPPAPDVTQPPSENPPPPSHPPPNERSRQQPPIGSLPTAEQVEAYLKRISDYEHPADKDESRPRRIPHRGFTDTDEASLEKLQAVRAGVAITELADFDLMYGRLINRLVYLQRKNEGFLGTKRRVNNFLDSRDAGLISRIKAEHAAKPAEENKNPQAATSESHPPKAQQLREPQGPPDLRKMGLYASMEMTPSQKAEVDAAIKSKLPELHYKVFGVDILESAVNAVQLVDDVLELAFGPLYAPISWSTGQLEKAAETTVSFYRTIVEKLDTNKRNNKIKKQREREQRERKKRDGDRQRQNGPLQPSSLPI